MNWNAPLCYSSDGALAPEATLYEYLNKLNRCSIRHCEHLAFAELRSLSGTEILQAAPSGIVVGTAAGAVALLQQAATAGASSYCGGGGWMQISEAVVDGGITRLALDAQLRHALVATTANVLWCEHLLVALATHHREIACCLIYMIGMYVFIS